jgi:4-amino-4-deoxy-L-arabinose transferase-like glycosyltransferase
MNLPYWLAQALEAMPVLALVYLGLGVPVALVLLPRCDWRQRATVLAVAFAAAPALLTLWMFVLGTLGGAQQKALLRPDLILGGVLVMMGVATGAAWVKMRRTSALQSAPESPFAFDERLLMLLILLAVVIRWVVTAFWTFTTYDALWVYGYQGRLYFEHGFIPPNIGYYPQFLSLQYAFAQIMVGRIDDHAARMVIPFLHVGSILAVYVLGRRLLDNRRIGIIAAALWAFYPHVSEWAHEGDLEIPLAFLFTLAALFFLQAWISPEKGLRRHYAVLSGLMLGVALWTKPTAGGFVWGVLLLVAIDGLAAWWRAAPLRLDLRSIFQQWYPRFEAAFITGLACVPIGGIWYLRNVLLGHNPIDLPHFSWLDRARRSGDLFGWLLLAGFVLLAWLYVRRVGILDKEKRTHYSVSLLIASSGYALIWLGALASMPTFNPARFDPPMSYITLAEAALMLAGSGIMSVGLYRVWQLGANLETNTTISRMGWALLLALPYFVTWFYSYSYHYRLSFAIVPLLLLPTAVLLARWLPHPPTGVRRIAYVGLLVLVCIPGLIGTYWNAARDKDWLWSDKFPDDTARYKEHNPDMVIVAEQLQYFINDYDRDPVVVAPGEQRLPFFFPLMTIITNTVPTRLDELEGVTHYIYGSQPEWRYQDEHIPPQQNQIVSALGREDVMQRKLRYTDGTFRYELYEVHLENRQRISTDYLYQQPDEVVFGDFARLVGYAMSNSQLAGNNIFYGMTFEVLKTPDQDYKLALHLVNVDDGKVYHESDGYLAQGEHGYYSALLWDAGEMIATSGLVVKETDAGAFIPGKYVLLVTFYTEDADGTRHYVPVTVNGETTDGYRIPNFQFN